MDLVVVLNEFATLFREIGDKDYVSARSSYQLRLREQFFWAGLQALEKYLKGILLFNKQSIVKFRNHDLAALAQEVLQRIPWISFQWPSSLGKTLKRFRDLGENRYLSTDTYVRPENLTELDEAVWHVRPYCQYVRVTVKQGSVDLTQHYVRAINSRTSYRHPRQYKPSFSDGFLEKVLTSRQSDPARRALVWNNRFFGTGKVRPTPAMHWSSSQVPPNRRYWFAPAIKREVEKYIYFPSKRNDVFLF